jgi:hypothetical protein
VKLRFTLGVGVMLLAVAGCGGSVAPTLNVPTERVMSYSAGKTKDAGSSKVSFSAVVHAGGQELTFGGAGEFDYKARAGKLTLDLTNLLAAAGLADAKFDVVFQGLVVYMRFPAAIAKTLPGGGAKPWIKIDLARVGKLSGIDLGQLQQLNQDPSQILDSLRGAVDVKKIGEDEVRGTKTTHYSATIDLNRVAATAPAGLRPSIEQAIKQTGTATFPVEVWVDGAGRMRRFAETLSVNTGGTAATTEIAMDLYDFGTKVQVQPPPADQTIDLADIAAQRS